VKRKRDPHPIIGPKAAGEWVEWFQFFPEGRTGDN
jgi:hypothetical protein